MSLEFKIKEWRFEIDWKGMTAEPILQSTDQPVSNRRRRQVIRGPRAPKPGIREQAERIRRQTEEGENEAWI